MANVQATPDTIVVGAGVVGLATGYELASRGQKVLVLEREQVGSGVSGVGGGFICQQTHREPLMLALVRESLKYYHSLGDRLGADIGYRPCGSLCLAGDEAEAQQLLRHAEHLSGYGVATTPLDGDQARELEPLVAGGVAAGLHCRSDAQIDPPRVLRAYRDALEREGSEVREGRMVVGLREERDRVVGVRTRYGDLDANAVVLASGSWTPVLLPHSYAALVRPRRGQLLVAKPRRRCIQHLLLGGDYLRSKLREATLGLSLEQTVDGVLRLGGTREWTGYDERPTALLCEVLDNARRYVELPDDVVWSRAVAGLRPATTDGLPLLGLVQRGLWIAAGHEGSGYSAAPASAARLAAAILGQPSDLRAFSPTRLMTPKDTPTAGHGRGPGD